MQGTILGSRYQVIEYIAKGGFGKTYLAEDTQLPGKDKCVVKQLFPSVDDPNFIKVARRLFNTEAETLNTLGIHNQIPQLLAYFEEDEKFYLVQQYIEGHTLSQELVTGEPWSEAKVVELLQDCLNILDFIHVQGVIHRDVKPDNLIRRQSDNKLVLVDFGTVKEVIAEQTQLIPATVAVGTRGYMPTEQARGKPRITSDIYALGIIAIQALTGVHPIALQENDDGEIVWQDKAECSEQLKEIVAQMTRYHFRERYQSAQETMAALTSLSNPSAKSPAEGVAYTPTVQLSDSRLANMSRNPQGTVVGTSSLADDRSVLNVPEKLVSCDDPEPLELVANHSQPLAPSDSSRSEANESNMSNTQKSSKTLITIGVALAMGAIASGGMYFLNQQTERTAKANQKKQVDDLSEMIDQQDYQGCYDRVISINTQAGEAQPNIMPPEQQQELTAQCGLALAQAEAEDLKYDAALAIAKTLPRNTSIDAQIQQQINTWSQQLLARATTVYEQQGNLNQAIDLVKQIPQDSEVRSQVIDAKNAWKAESQANETLIMTAQKALSEEKWQYAKQQATKVKDASTSMYWKEQAKAIISQAEEGITASSSTTPETKANPLPATTSISQPNVTPVKPKVSNLEINSAKSNPAVINPESKPTTRVNQDSSGSLRDLGGNSKSSPKIPSNNDSLRDL